MIHKFEIWKTKISLGLNTSYPGWMYLQASVQVHWRFVLCNVYCLLVLPSLPVFYLNNFGTFPVDIVTSEVGMHRDPVVRVISIDCTFMLLHPHCKCSACLSNVLFSTVTTDLVHNSLDVEWFHLVLHSHQFPSERSPWAENCSNI